MTNARGILLFSLIYTCFVVTAFGLLEINVNGVGGAWGSDALYYHETAERVTYGYSQERIDGRFYVYFHSFILQIYNSAVFPSAILCFMYATLLMVNIAWDKRTHLLFHFATIGNPIIFWTIARGMKEGLIVVVLLTIYSISRLLNASKLLYFLGPIMLIIFSFFMQGIRPLGLEVSVFIGIIASIVWLKFNGIVAFLLLLLITPLLADLVINLFDEHYIIKRLVAQREVFMSQIGVDSLSESLSISSLRFILGPGPLKPLLSKFTDLQFLEPMYAGVILITIGSLLWWTFLLTISLNILKRSFEPLRRISLSYFDNFFLIMCSVQILTYTIVYGGLVDTRHRAIMYLALYPVARILVKNTGARRSA